MLRTMIVGSLPQYATKLILSKRSKYVSVNKTGGAALTEIKRRAFDVIYVVEPLFDMGPAEFITELRSTGTHTPVIALIFLAKDLQARAAGCECLRAGADDFIVSRAHPQWMDEVEAVTEAVKRRCDVSGPTKISYGLTTLNLNDQTCVIDGHKVQFAPKEFDLMCLFVRARGTVATIARLHELTYGAEGVVQDHTIKVRVNKMRHKIADATGKNRHHFLQTKKGFHQGRGEGYFLIGENDGKQDMGYSTTDLAKHSVGGATLLGSTGGKVHTEGHRHG